MSAQLPPGLALGWLTARVAANQRVTRLAYLVVKRTVDLAICLVFMPLLAVLFAWVALAIRLESPGPVLFTQLRTGRDGKRFQMYKFRTMVRNAEDLKESLRHLSIVPPPDFKIPNDPRITRIGRVLRKTSLDEVPQLLNVLRGEMTLVGPRPTSFEPASYALWHTARLEVRPGLTGLWQVRGRNSMTFDERLRLDLTYIARMSPLLDLVILVQTVGEVLRRSGE